MKYIVSLLIGMLIGAVLFVLGLYFNPFIGQPSVSPLAVSDDLVVDLGFSGVPADGILTTNNGDSIVQPHPDRVAELWEPAVADTNVLVTMLADSRGEPAGVGIKFFSPSESTRLIRGEAIANSAWHIYVPGEGTLMIDQTENYWSYLRDVVVPARMSAGNNWRGTYHRIMTHGPGSLGTARVTGGSGNFSTLQSEAVESLTARGYSSVSGPVSMDRSLTIAFPRQESPEE